jgi:DNA-3-methyladenine glycosylase
MASPDRPSQEALPRAPLSRENLPRETLPRDFFARPAVEVAPSLLGCVLTRETAAGLVAVRLTEVEAYAGQADPASHAYRGPTARNAVMFGPPGHAYVYFTYGMHFCMNLVCMPSGTPFAVLLRAGEVIAGEELAWSRRYGAPADVVRGPDGSAARGMARTTRDLARGIRDLARGPARLCQALGIDRSLDGADVCDPGSPLLILPPPQLASGGPPASAPALGTGSGPVAPAPAQHATPAAPTLTGTSAALTQRATSTAPTQRATSAAPTSAAPTPPVAGRIMTGPRVGVREAADVPWRFWLDGEPTVSPYRPHAPRKRGASRQVGDVARMLSPVTQARSPPRRGLEPEFNG